MVAERNFQCSKHKQNTLPNIQFTFSKIQFSTVRHSRKTTFYVDVYGNINILLRGTLPNENVDDVDDDVDNVDNVASDVNNVDNVDDVSNT